LPVDYTFAFGEILISENVAKKLESAIVSQSQRKSIIDPSADNIGFLYVSYSRKKELITF